MAKAAGLFNPVIFQRRLIARMHMVRSGYCPATYTIKLQAKLSGHGFVDSLPHCLAIVLFRSRCQNTRNSYPLVPVLPCQRKDGTGNPLSSTP